MTAQAGRNNWWIARWLAAAVLLIIPLAMQIGAGGPWKPVGFLLAGALILGSLMLYEFAAGRSASAAYRAGVAIAAATSFLTVWTTIVRDDGNGIGFFLLVLTAAVGAFAAGFRAEGMARAMLGVAGAQGVLAAFIATAPSTDWPLGILTINSFFAALWLISAACFWNAAQLRRR